MKRLALIAVSLLAIFSCLFVIADHLGYTDEQHVATQIRALEHSPRGQLLVAGAIIGLLAIDLLLPVPSSVVMAVSGMVFGAWLGTLISFAGALLAALLGFYACRWGGRRVFQRLLGEDDRTAIDEWFGTYGVYAILFSRPVPMLTEILSCLAGLSDLRPRTFILATALGTFPVCLVYGYFGSVSSPTNPWPAACVALLIPAVGWLVVRRIKARSRPPSSTPSA